MADPDSPPQAPILLVGRGSGSSLKASQRLGLGPILDLQRQTSPSRGLWSATQLILPTPRGSAAHWPGTPDPGGQPWTLGHIFGNSGASPHQNKARWHRFAPLLKDFPSDPELRIMLR